MAPLVRETVLRGVTDLPWQQVSALTMFVLALGALLRFGDLRSTHASHAEEPLPQPGVKRQMKARLRVKNEGS